MDEVEIQNKKSYWYIYVIVFIVYIVEITTYVLVVNNAAEDGALNVYCDPDAPT